jgi:hypothetical protein
MPDFNVRTDAVDVDDIMRQIRARIRDKRGADYTEAEVSQLAGVKLEKFVEQHRRRATEGSGTDFTEEMLYETPKPWLRRMRRLLNPILRLFFDPAVVAGALRKDRDELQFEVIHNLVVEVTRLGIDVHNLKMRLESLSSRVDFDERRARVVESAPPFRPPVPRPEPRRDQRPPRQESRPMSRSEPRPEVRAEVRPIAAPPEAARIEQPAGAPAEAVAVASVPGAPAIAGPPDGERRRRRRRRRRRPGQGNGGAPVNGATPANGNGSGAPAAGSPTSTSFDDDGPDDGPEE